MRFSAADFQARILHRDGAMLILDKPYGIAVHRGPKGGVTLDDFLPDLAFEKPEMPQLAHRLDRETTGCLVLGRDKAALKKLGEMFRDGRVEKTYLAIVLGGPREEHGAIDLALTRRSHDKRSWWMKADPKGDPSLTRFAVLGRSDGFSLLAMRPETGRTHQLRVHAAESGFAIVGDRVYGGDRAMAVSPELALHAFAISVPYARKGPPVNAMAPLPDAFRGLAEGLQLGEGLVRALASPFALVPAA
jgi:RluA family pseudouridine synthase